MGLPPVLLEKVYFKGLKLEIHPKVHMINPPKLIAIMDTSLQVEKPIVALWHALKSSSALDYSTSQLVYISTTPMTHLHPILIEEADYSMEFN